MGRPGRVDLPFTSNTWDAEADRSLWIQEQPDLQSKFLAMQDYIVRMYFQ